MDTLVRFLPVTLTRPHRCKYVMLCLCYTEKCLEMPVKSWKLVLNLKIIYCYVRSDASIGQAKRKETRVSEALGISNCKYGNTDYIEVDCCEIVCEVGSENSGLTNYY